nr:hypothetical protein [uncultured Carboxylicivirga sp.]
MYKYFLSIVLFMFTLTSYGQNDDTHYYFYHYHQEVNSQWVLVISTIFEMDAGNYTKSKIKKQWSENLILEDLEKYACYATSYDFMPREDTQQEAVKERRAMMAEYKKKGYEIVEIKFNYIP